MAEKIGDTQDNQVYIRGHIFDGVGYDRTITCKGALIRISDPNAVKGADPYWEYEVTTQDATHLVPAWFGVEVIHGWVKLTKSTAA